MDQLKNTKSFKKRFHGLSLKDKVAVAGLVNNVVVAAKMPSGRVVDDNEKEMLQELCVWCDENIFFNMMPNGRYAEHQYGLK